MIITFYGTRGSTPMPEEGYLKSGGHTSSILLEFNSGDVVILDAGTGIRKIGQHLSARPEGVPENIFIGMSHTHWDHIQGFPFFGPAYNPRQKLTIAISGEDYDASDLETVFKTQMQSEFFPVPLDQMGAKITFWQPNLNRYTTSNGITIQSIKHNHPGNAYTYRIEELSTTIVYCTDIEHGESIDERIVELASGVDLLIHDAMYTNEQLKTRKGWGHSSWEQAVEVAERAEVQLLALFHHDPDHDDTFLDKIEEDARERFPASFLAREGMAIKILP
ncbi:MAG: MBL fold metallo-hydrolase [Candidatus Electryonea clarkiae]|nr:MBL fold metallo-hydrolase [Candidatus Electryonea clarkiae]MDP8287027.1 MBL fold metallo-hydrolase [Candidatus Electryonea clarkiae]